MRYVSKENLSQFWGGVKSWLNDKFTITKNKITDWPSTFPPSSHTHTISQIDDLQNQLNGKSSTAHNHDGRYLKTNIKAVTLSKNSLTYTFPSIAIGEIVYASVNIPEYSNSDNAYSYEFRASNAGNYLSFSFCLPTKVSSSPRLNLISNATLLTSWKQNYDSYYVYFLVARLS